MRKESGFSFVELLLTVVFVLLGSQMIQGGFLRAADMFGRYSNTLKTLVWAEGTMNRAREALIRDELETGTESGVYTLSGKDYSWTRQMQSMDGPGLYSLRLSVAWTESGKPFSIHKEIYVHHPDLPQT